MKRIVFVLLGAALLLSCSKEKEIPVQSVSVNPATLSITVGDTAPLTAVITPSDASAKEVAWSSSLTSVATVSSTGVVTATGVGSVVISAVVGGKTGTCTVTVGKRIIDVTSVTLDKESLSLEKGDNAQLTATVNPKDATDKTVTWSSSDPSVVSVDQNGRVSALAGGDAVITAQAGDCKASCPVSVTVPVSGIALNQNSLVLAPDETATLTAILSPEDVTAVTIVWSSSDVQIVTVDENGNVKAVGSGNAVITAQAGSCKATCSVLVTVPVQSVSIQPDQLTLEEEETAQLEAIVLPADATDKSVSWSSSDPAVATISGNGLLSALKVGTVTITVNASGKTATCAVTVKEKTIPVTSITLDVTSIVMEKGASASLTPTVLPTDATDKTVTWTSSVPEVATVDENGVVYAVRGGKTVITAQAGDKTATCDVKVSVPIVDFSLNCSSYQLERGGSFTLVPIVTPDDADVETITWSTSDYSVATVDLSGNVQGQKTGTATITARAGSVARTCKVTVYVPVTSVTLDKTEVTIQEGRTLTLHATVNPTDATDKTVTWSSSDPTIVKVDADGKISALKPGSAVITAQAGDKTADCPVTVTEKNSNTEDFGDKEGEW